MIPFLSTVNGEENLWSVPVKPEDAPITFLAEDENGNPVKVVYSKEDIGNTDSGKIFREP